MKLGQTIMPESVEQRAITFATQFLEKRGYAVQNVSASREHKGYDLIAERRGEKALKIEVKGCTRPWGIPDPYVTEFDSQRRLVADFLYVVYFIGSDPPALCAIPRESIPPDLIVPKMGYRISSRFKKERILKKFIQER